MDSYMRGQRGFVGAADYVGLNEQETLFVDQDDSMNIHIGHTVDADHAVVDDTEAVVLHAQSDEFEHVYVPPCESEDCDLNDIVLKCISDILMEEDAEKESWMFQESAALQAAEKSFYQVLQERLSPSPGHHQVPDTDQNVEIQDKNYADGFSIPNITTTFTDEFTFLNMNVNPHLSEAVDFASGGFPSESASLSSYSPSSTGSSCSSSQAIDGSLISPDRMVPISSMFSNSETMMHFTKGVEEGREFLPVVDGFNTSVRPVELSEKVQVESLKRSEVNADKRNREIVHDISRTRKNPDYGFVDLQDERRNKQSTDFSVSMVGSEEFNRVLLRDFEQTGSSAREAIQSGESRNDAKDLSSKGSVGGKSHVEKRIGGRRAVNLKALLILCADAVAAEDIHTANKFLRQIREHSSPTGDGMQRLAHYFANGLEARMSGIGNSIGAFHGLPSSACDVLWAYQLCLASCPFGRVSNFFANRVIMNLSKNSTRLHIIHFGIFYGFQWPSFMQRLSCRPGGPPKLRITGIDVPCPGFKPAARVEETGRLLANYARNYGISFEFRSIAQNWETIKIEDLKLEEGEVLAVNCLYRMRMLYDETVMPRSPRANNPRNNVLSLIKNTNPDVFILGVVNGAYNSSFFTTRFREALFYFSSLFDMLDTNIPRDTPERMLIEKMMFGRQAINVIACETGDRVERPESYKQWQFRNIRAGFRPLPLDEEIKTMAIQHVKMSYHKDFSIIEDGHWLLQGWKGRNLFAISSWEPAQ